MWSIIEPLHLIRYLLVWKVNRKMVRLPHCLPVDLSRVLGTLIAERLPTREAQPWRKASSKWEGYDSAARNDDTRIARRQPAQNIQTAVAAAIVHTDDFKLRLGGCPHLDQSLV